MPFNVNNPNHIIIGLGGTGGKVLKAFKKRFFKEFPSPELRNGLTDHAVAFLYVDSTREMLKPDDPTFRVAGQDASFTPQEFLDIKSIDLNQILDNIDNYPGLKHIVKNATAMRTTLGEVGAAAGQKRRAGRILFAANCNRYLAALNDRYETLRRQTRVDSLHIHIITGLAGGTGSGSIIDAVAQARVRYPEATIDVYAMVPELDIPVGCQAGRYHQNGYAALRELSAMNVCRYLPCDVITGAEHVTFNELPLKQFGLMVYSNVNENGLVVDSFTELPELIADAIYFRVFLKEKGQITENFMRAWSCENFNDFLVEYDSKFRGPEPPRARTKGVATIGTKRIEYPEVRIQEHINYTVVLDIIKQMLYNNFKEEMGYVADPVRVDYKEKYTSAAQLKEWHIDDSHLQLDVRILPTDKTFQPINEFWNGTAHTYTYEEAKSFNKHQPYTFLYNYCEDQFLGRDGGKFRLGRGVEEYYNDKADERVLKEQVAYIVDQIEQRLYSNWADGLFSIHDLSNICEVLLEYFNKKIQGLSSEVTKNEAYIEQCQRDRADMAAEWETTGPIKGVFVYPRLYGEFQELYTDMFTAMTKRHALTFQGRILLKLRNEFISFQDQISAFIGKLQKSQEYLVNAVSERTRNSDFDLQGTVIEVSEDAKVVILEEEIRLTKPLMESYAAELRKAITQGASYAHFSDLANRIHETTISDFANEILTSRILTYHNENCTEDKKVIGINVLQQLQKILQTDSQIRKFAEDIIHQSGVFMKFNQGHLTRALDNNPNPVQRPESMNQQTILVTIPTCEGDDTLREFTNKLVRCMSESFGNATPGSRINFDLESTRKNEISIITIKACFPLRCLEWVANYDKEYRDMINNSNEASAKQAMSVLHSEGDGTHLPELMGEPESPRGARLIPYIFIAAVSNNIKYTQDYREETGWCLTDVDMFGAEIITLISKRFIEIESGLSSDQAEAVFDAANEVLSNKDIKVSERNELKQAVVALMRDKVAVECGGPNSPKYKEYSTAALQAMEMIDKM